MNTKDKKYGRIINIRLTEQESDMAKELREKFNINISSLIRNTIKAEHEKVLQRN